MSNPTPPESAGDLSPAQIRLRPLRDAMIVQFTPTIPMDWMLPGVPPTGKRVEVPLVAGTRDAAAPLENIRKCV